MLMLLTVATATAVEATGLVTDDDGGPDDDGDDDLGDGGTLAREPTVTMRC